MEYRQGSHTKYKIEYHFVWVTKYRYHLLVGELALRVRELVRQTCERYEIQILRGVVSKDHVHILVSAPPDISTSTIMRWLKGRTSRKIFEKYPHVKKRYWGQHFWARGYFCVTAGELTKEMIDEYLSHHFEPPLMTVSMLSREPAAQPAGNAGLSVRCFKPTDFESVVV